LLPKIPLPPKTTAVLSFRLIISFTATFVEFYISKSFLEKFGLYCAACDASMGESIEEGCKIHGLEEEDTNKLIFELNQLLSIERKDK